MALTLEDIDRIAHLARLRLQPDARARMMAGINEFFTVVEAMRAVDTRGVQPLAHPVAANPQFPQGVALRLRDDAVTEPDNRAANQRSAPAVEDGLFLVPRVIE